MSAGAELSDLAAEAAGFAAARFALARYGDLLLRRIAAQFGRQRIQNERDELIEHIIASIDNPVLIDRTLKGLSPAARRLLRLVATSRQMRWRVQSFVDIGSILGTNDGIGPVQELLDAGLAFPEVSPRAGRINGSDEWLAAAITQPLAVWIAPLAAERAREPLSLPKIDFDVLPHSPLEADGLEWPLRLSVAWQFVHDGPLRLTQQSGFFKRDLDRLRSHPILGSTPPEEIGAVPDAPLLAIELAQAAGLLIREDEQVRGSDFGDAWSNGLGPTLASLWTGLNTIENWKPTLGAGPSRPIAPIVVLSVALLAELPADQWALVDEIDSALTSGPDVDAGDVSALLLGVLHQLRLVQAAKHKDRWWVRLTDVGQALAAGREPSLPPPALEQTLVVQPNLEIVLYRQGCTPSLIARLSHVAEWRSLGLACTLGLTAESVYRGLEAGESLGELLALFERHSTRPLADSVINSLRSWASKRERVLVFPAALVLEFRDPAELDRAVRLGLVEHRITDRIGLIGAESKIDYQQFRLIGTRDYLASDELCVEVAGDGLTLSINEHKSDLLLESELRRFAERGDSDGERPQYRLTQASLRAARQGGLNAAALDAWFGRRAGQPLPASAQLLLTADESAPFELASHVMLRVPSEELGDGLAQWPETAGLLGERLSGTVFLVPAEQIAAVRAVLERLGVRFEAAGS